MGLTVSSGAIDAISFLALGKVFTAFMTGNIVFLGLLAAGSGTQDLASVVVAIASFAAGAYLAARTVGLARGTGVWPLRVTAALGGTALAQACFLAVWVADGGRLSGGGVVVLIALWALAMGAQTGAISALGLPGIFTPAATATLTYLTSDASRPSSATDMPRLAGLLVSLFVGAAAGALLLAYARSYAPLFPLVLTVSVVATSALALREPAEAKDRPPRVAAS